MADPLHIHHIDGDRENNKTANLVQLCKECHMMRHKEMRRDRRLAENPILKYQTY